MLARLSRRESMMLTDAIGLIGSLLGQVVSVYAICVSRFIIGMAVGLNSTLVIH